MHVKLAPRFRASTRIEDLHSISARVPPSLLICYHSCETSQVSQYVIICDLYHREVVASETQLPSEEADWETTAARTFYLRSGEAGDQHQLK